MVGRRRKEDPVLAAQVRERLTHILTEALPRRAKEQPSPKGGPSADPPPFEASEADWPVEDDQKVLPVVPPVRRHPFTGAHMTVIAAVLIVGLLFAGWAVLRARPVALATPLGQPGPVASVSAEPSRSPSATPVPTPASIKVHVLGAVKKPGVVRLSEGSRVSDALAAAGGLISGADPAELNLAQLLADGQQVVVGTDQKPGGEVRDGTGGTGTGASGAAPSASGRLNLNSATATQLESLPGVGPVTAEKIVGWRTENGRFTQVEELQEVDGIGPKTFAEIAPHVRV